MLQTCAPVRAEGAPPRCHLLLLPHFALSIVLPALPCFHPPPPFIARSFPHLPSTTLLSRVPSTPSLAVSSCRSHPKTLAASVPAQLCLCLFVCGLFLCVCGFGCACVDATCASGCTFRTGREAASRNHHAAKAGQNHGEAQGPWVRRTHCLDVFLSGLSAGGKSAVDII